MTLLKIHIFLIVSLPEHLLCLVPINDNLKHRPRAEWSVVYMTCELHAAEIWLRSAIQENKESNEVRKLIIVRIQLLCV